MDTRYVLRSLFPGVLLFGGVAFGEDRVSINLTPRQAEVLIQARQLYGQDWRVMVAAHDGGASAIVLLAQAASYAPDELEMAKNVIDRFEHFAVRKDSSARTETPARVAELGLNTKSVIDLGGREIDRLATAGGAKETLARGLRDGVAQALNVALVPDNLKGVAQVGWLVAEAFELASTILPVALGLRRQEDCVRAIAKYVARWTYRNAESSPLVVIVDEATMSKVQRRLWKSYAFRPGQPICAEDGCEVAASH